MYQNEKSDEGDAQQRLFSKRLERNGDTIKHHKDHPNDLFCIKKHLQIV